MTHPTPTHPSPGGPGRILDRFQPPWGRPRPKPRPGPPPPRFQQRCPDPLPHGPHPVPARGSWTRFQCAGRPSAAEQDRELDEAFGLEPQTT